MNRDISQYKIFNEIGKGSFGKVYKGIDKLTGEEVALKFIEKKQKRTRELKNLQQQNELLKKINHPNVIALKAVIDTPKEVIIITDYAGRDLSGVIEEVKRFSLEKVKQYSIQILNAMLYLNENRIIHRDLKPQNILIKGNHIKICDFGFAKKLSASTNFMQSMKGTPLYLAPEIVRELKYTQKVDIWSFGCIIYELFTGRTPYYASTYQKLIPLILHQPVQYPKEMSAEIKDLIASMLQKNPSSRPDWKELKNHSFFRQNQVLKQKFQSNLKQVVSIEIPDKSYFPQKFNSPQEKENNKILINQQNPIDSKVIQKIQNENEMKGYEKQFQKIHSDLMSNLIDGKELRRDPSFLHKVKTIFHERSQQKILMTDTLLEATIGIISQLVKLKKGKNNNENNNENDDDDITKNDALIFGLLCVSKVEKNYDLLEKELKLIARLVKSIFNGVAINSEVDQEITEFVAEILLENSDKLPIQCIQTGLIVIGTMVNQAITTLNNSFDYFERMAEDKLLSKIAKIYRKEEKYSTVLQLLKTIIHPVQDVQSMTGHNPNQIMNSKLERTFLSLKEEVAEALIKTNFISELSPLEAYGLQNPALINYCEILLECLKVSEPCRKQFLKYTYWQQFLKNHRLRAYLFAYNVIFLDKQNKSMISNEQFAKYTQQSHENKIVTSSILWMSYFRARTKPDCKTLTQYKMKIIQKVHDNLFVEEDVKKKSCLEVYGMLETTTKMFDQPLISIFFNLVNETKTQNSEEFKDLALFVQKFFKKICNTSVSFKPNSKSLYWLMTLFTNNDIMKTLRNEKSVQLFFYECISDFIKREDFEYLENEFAEKQIHAFVSKLVQCLNLLIQIEDTQSKSSNLSANAINLTKQIQSSSFHRQMFMDGLIDDQFYELIKYSQKVVSKTIAFPEFVTFLGVKVIPMCRNYINTKFEPLMIEMFVFISLIARDHSQFNTNILETGIIKKLKEWLIDEKYSESIKEKALYLIGNLAKKSDFFFGEFQTFSVMESITSCLQKFSLNVRILKNTIYAIGNISFYSQKFYKEIEPMIPYFSKAFEMNDAYMRSNLISTVSNLLRYSSIFLSQLIKTGLIGNILKIACESQVEQSVAGLIMSLIKKMLPYDEFYQAFGVKELKNIYQRRQLFGGDNNETIKKIREVLISRGEFN